MKVDSIAPLANLVELRDLDMASCWTVEDMEPLSALTNLSVWGIHLGNLLLVQVISLVNVFQWISVVCVMHMSCCMKANSIAPLSNLVELRDLDMASCWTVENMGPLSSLTNLSV